MEKIFKRPLVCDECNENLGNLFLFCRSCNKFICFNCFSHHKIEHNYLPCISLDETKAKVLDVGFACYGPPMENRWPSHDIEVFNSSYHPKCEHAIDYFKKNNITFFCKKCNKWLCLECIDNHLDHGLMLHVGFNNGKTLRQIDPKLYKIENQISLSVNATTTEENIIKMK